MFATKQSPVVCFSPLAITFLQPDFIVTFAFTTIELFTMKYALPPFCCSNTPTSN